MVIGLTRKGESAKQLGLCSLKDSVQITFTSHRLYQPEQILWRRRLVQNFVHTEVLKTAMSFAHLPHVRCFNFTGSIQYHRITYLRPMCRYHQKTWTVLRFESKSILGSELLDSDDLILFGQMHTIARVPVWKICASDCKDVFHGPSLMHQ